MSLILAWSISLDSTFNLLLYFYLYCRNCIVNVGETVVYDAVKDYLVGQGRMKEGVPAHLSRCNDDIQKPPFVEQL